MCGSFFVSAMLKNERDSVQYQTRLLTGAPVRPVTPGSPGTPAGPL